MKILAINSSPRGKQSNTDRLLQPFLEGAKSRGAETETLYLRDYRIEPCRGCFSCWIKTPGQCVIKDDMAGLLEKVNGADGLGEGGRLGVAILQENGELLGIPDLAAKVAPIVAAARRAGEEYVGSGSLSWETQEALAAPITSIERQQMLEYINEMWRQSMEAGTFGGSQGPSQSPCRDLLKMMPWVYNGDKDFRAVIQFQIHGDEEFSGYLAMADGQCAYHDGEHPEPNLTITAPAQVWLDLSSGKLSGPLLAFNPLAGIDLSPQAMTPFFERKKQILSVMEEVVRQGIDRGEIRPGDSRRLMLCLYAMGEGLLLTQDTGLAERYGLSLDELIEEALGLIAEGILQR